MELEVYGKEQLMARLANLQHEVLDKAAEHGIKEVAEKIRDTAKILVPVDTGSLRASIRLQVHAMPAQHVHKIGVSAGGYVLNPKTKMRVNYASFVEFGTSRQRAQPYLRPAIERHKTELPKLAKEALSK